MLNSHTSLGIAQVVFYVPTVPFAIYLFVRNRATRPRLAWWPLIPLSLMRLAGGAILIALEKHPTNIALIVAAFVLLNVGVIPLLVSTIGFVRIILMDNFGHNSSPHRFTTLGLRLSIIAASGLLGAGAGVSSKSTQSARNLGRYLTLAGYVVFAVVLVLAISMELYFWRRRATLTACSRKVLKAALLAAPFIVIRNIYGILEVVFEHSLTSVWSPLYGSTVAFALMALLMEYIVIWLYLYVGYTMPPDRGVGADASADGEGKQVA